MTITTNDYSITNNNILILKVSLRHFIHTISVCFFKVQFTNEENRLQKRKFLISGRKNLFITSDTTVTSLNVLCKNICRFLLIKMQKLGFSWLFYLTLSLRHPRGQFSKHFMCSIFVWFLGNQIQVKSIIMPGNTNLHVGGPPTKPVFNWPLLM